MAGMNTRLNPKVETMFLMASERKSFIASRFVKESPAWGADISTFVPAAVNRRVWNAIREIGMPKCALALVFAAARASMSIRTLSALWKMISFHRAVSAGSVSCGRRPQNKRERGISACLFSLIAFQHAPVDRRRHEGRNIAPQAGDFLDETRGDD